MKNSLIFSYSRLRKFEFADFVKGVISIVKKHDAEALKIEGMVALLLEQEPHINKLIVSFGKHPLSSKIKGLRLKRNTMLDAIFSQVDSVEAASMESAKSSLNLAVPFLRRILYGIKSVNEKERTERISQLITVKADTPLHQALVALGFEVYLAEVRRMQNEIDQLVKERVKSLSERPRMNTSKITKSVSTTLVNLFRKLELAKLENAELDYDPLINELNVWSVPYVALIKGRDTRNSTKLEIEETDKMKTAALSSTTTATV